MNVGVTLRTILTFAILVALHYTLRPLLGWRAEIDFMLLALLVVSVRLRPGVAALLGFVIGLIADSLNPGTLGASALAMSVVAYVASWLKAVFFADNITLNAFFFFVGKWLFDIIFVAAEHRLGGVAVIQQLLLWSPLSACATAIGGVLLLLTLRPLLDTATT
jgi:rod shape-determining protein MreD